MTNFGRTNRFFTRGRLSLPQNPPKPPFVFIIEGEVRVIKRNKKGTRFDKRRSES